MPVVLGDGWRFHRGDSPGYFAAPRAQDAMNATALSCSLPAFCSVDLDDSQWLRVTVPHDWSIDDLPPREDDTLAPVLSLRNGTWRIRRGDNDAWRAFHFNDSQWRQARMPADCFLRCSTPRIQRPCYGQLEDGAIFTTIPAVNREFIKDVLDRLASFDSLWIGD
eukprot:1909528-Pleurochrysis_carterae.AAC.1